jgi:thioesterase domain-containing protein
MLPTAVVHLDGLPLGANGKVDRRALPEPDVTHHGKSRGDDTERWLAGIWADALNVAHVDLDDDFFALGGDSLAGAQIVARVEVETGRSIPLGALVRASSVRQFAGIVAESHSNGTSTLTVLRAGDENPPLILVHGNTGSTVHYAGLVRANGPGRPLWGLEYSRPGADVHVDAIVRAHLGSLLESKPSGPYLLAGFCYGAAIAYELACRLVARGQYAQVALLGITPIEFPTLVPSAARVRWGPADNRTVLTRLRQHGTVARRLPVRKAVPYLAERSRSAARQGWRRLRGEPDAWSSPAQAALALHRPEPFPGRPLVVLHRDDASRYTSDPTADWGALGTEGVEVVLLPGGDHAMLEPRGVCALAEVLGAWAASAEHPRKR